jgi:hypothetical protein
MLAATADVTNCRFFNSTYVGAAGAFFDMRNMLPPERVIRMHWADHPMKRLGLYQDHDGRPRSPWYDKECLRRRAADIACNLDINPQGSGGQRFDPVLVARLKKECRPPVQRGDFEEIEGAGDRDNAGADPAFNSPVSYVFVPRDEGALRLWNPLEGGRPGLGKYVLGVDVSTGIGATPSVVSIVNCQTGEKVGEWVSNRMPSYRLGAMVAQMARWFKSDDGPAFVIWEINGEGHAFAHALMETGFRNFYTRRQELSLKRRATPSPGWASGKNNKRYLLGLYEDELREGRFKNPSIEAVRELEEYVNTASGEVEHAKAIHAETPEETGESHGDRVIADALACFVMRRVKPEEKKERPGPPPRGSFEWRMLFAHQHDASAREAADPWRW